MNPIFRIISLAILVPTFLIAMFVGNILVLMLLPVPFYGHQITSYTIGLTKKLLMFIFVDVIKMNFVISGDELEAGESSVAILNHQCFFDFVVGIYLANTCSMIYYLRYFMKESIKFIPLFGIYLWGVGNFILKRSFEKDKQQIEDNFSFYKKHKFPLFLCIFCEGTRWSPEKYAESVEFCKNRNLTPFKHILYPRYKGFLLTMREVAHSHVKNLYAVTLWYARKRNHSMKPKKAIPEFPSLLEMLWYGFENYTIFVKIKRYSIEHDLPDLQNETALKSWLVDAHKEIDKNIDYFIAERKSKTQ